MNKWRVSGWVTVVERVRQWECAWWIGEQVEDLSGWVTVDKRVMELVGEQVEDEWASHSV